MTSSSHPVEDLAFACLERMAEEGPAALEAICRQHPERAAALRHLVGQLRRLGFVGAPLVEEGLPQRIGEYRILRRLGGGGMGVVYLAEQERLQRQVALKLLRPGVLPQRRSRARFRREVEALSRLDHPHICTVYDAGEADGVPFLAMRHVTGATLAERIEQAREARASRAPSSSPDGAAPLPVLLVLLEKVARALHAAHEASVIHRDVKPANIIVDERGEPAVLDFGLARDELASDSQLTLSTDQIGTPGFMAPEQIAPELGAVDRRTDVYQLGVTAYQCLTLRLPFDVPTREGLYRAILAGEVTEARLLRRWAGRELSAVVQRAMAREPKQRFATALEFAEELERIRQHRPILTRRPGPVRRLAQWCRRNRVAAVFLAMMSLGLVGALVFAVVLRQRTSEFQMLANVLRLEEARAAEQQLYPGWPGLEEKLQAWLRDHGEVLSDVLPSLRETVRELEERALPQVPAKQDEERRAHPRFAEWERLLVQVQSLRLAQAVREARAPVQHEELAADEARLTARELEGMARPLVTWSETGRSWGREPRGLALAQAALACSERGDTSIPRPEVLTTLAMAWLANGCDQEARAAAVQAEAAGTARLTLDPGRAASRLQQCERQLRELDEEISRRRTWAFAIGTDDYLHRMLAHLVTEIEAFEQNELEGVRQRLSWAQRIDPLTNGHPHARATWEQACAAIARADGVSASELYHKHPIHLQAQTGLVPIGMNPVTKLWEFYHLRSAWDPASGADPKDLPIPEHRADGSFPVDGDTGIVFVLIPGGVFLMGAHKDDENAQPDEQLHEVTLAPFFLARHEMTRGQWRRLAGTREPGFFELGVRYTDAQEPIGLAHPVESVTPSMCDHLLEQHALQLPTEAQWEYGCRARTTTPWSCGTAADLPRYANLFFAAETEEKDRSQLQPVGSRQSNAFGLFDMHGNVAEWCRDRYGQYGLPWSAGDGFREVDFSSPRVSRGGSICDVDVDARSAKRPRLASDAAERTMGLRPARCLDLGTTEDPGRWIERTLSTSPPARFWTAMVFDSARQRLVLYGGSNSWPEVGPPRRLRDTWEWDGVLWQQRLPSANPGPREGHAMAYDSSRQRVVLFGGGSLYDYGGDTWEWDGTNWTLVAPEGAGPEPRWGHPMAYDAARRQVVMVGGRIQSREEPRDTWLWDGRAWTVKQDGTTPVIAAGTPMTYDSARQRTVLHHNGETWEWDGSEWSQPRPGTGPSGRGYAMAAYDAARRSTVLFGGGFWGAPGTGSQDNLADTWEWDGVEWSRRNPLTSPPARYGGAMAYDEARGRVVLFGGYRWAGPATGPDRAFSVRTVFADTWEYWDPAATK